jgi:hypothetical protein
MPYKIIILIIIHNISFIISKSKIFLKSIFTTYN